MNEKLKTIAAEDGYELAYFQESFGEHFFGLQIFVKMSNRKLCDKDKLYRIGDDIKNKLDTVSAELDPQASIKRERYRREIETIYKEAGVETIYMEAIPNGYENDPAAINRPWFRVTSRIGHVTIGWRRSVINIDWRDSTLKHRDAMFLFPHEDVTRGGNMIHAHGLAAATAYIRRLHSRCKKCGGCGSVSVPGELHDVMCFECDGTGLES